MEQESNFQEPHIYGENITSETKTKFTAWVEKEHLIALKPLSNEIDKTPRQLQAIDQLNNYIEQQFKLLALGVSPVLKPEQFHITKGANLGGYVDIFGAFLISSKKNSEYNDLLLPYVITHEGLHLSSRHQFAIKSFDPNHPISWEGIGYHRRNFRLHEKYPHFLGLDEAMAQKMTEEIYHNYNHDEELIVMERLHNSYKLYTAILDEIIKQVAIHKNQSIEETWIRFKKGFFTGKMYHLKDIERTFGKGSLRILAILGGIKPPWYKTLSAKGQIWERQIEKNVLEYFTTDDEQEKNRIANEILPKNEKKRYQNRRKS